MADCPTRYDVKTDQIIPVTQDWVDAMIAKLVEYRNAKQNSEASSNDGGGRTQSSVRQEDGHSTGSGEGVQQGGRREAQGKAFQQEVAVAWACTVDGWVQVPARAIRNSESPHIVWMLQATWEHLATHADVRGLFFIPCEVAPDAQHLRMLVNAKEIADAS